MLNPKLNPLCDRCNELLPTYNIQCLDSRKCPLENVGISISESLILINLKEILSGGVVDMPPNPLAACPCGTYLTSSAWLTSWTHTMVTRKKRNTYLQMVELKRPFGQEGRRERRLLGIFNFSETGKSCCKDYLCAIHQASSTRYNS